MGHGVIRFTAGPVRAVVLLCQCFRINANLRLIPLRRGRGKGNAWLFMTRAPAGHVKRQAVASYGCKKAHGSRLAFGTPASTTFGKILDSWNMVLPRAGIPQCIVRLRRKACHTHAKHFKIRAFVQADMS